MKRMSTTVSLVLLSSAMLLTGCGRKLTPEEEAKLKEDEAKGVVTNRRSSRTFPIFWSSGSRGGWSRSTSTSRSTTSSSRSSSTSSSSRSGGFGSVGRSSGS